MAVVGAQGVGAARRAARIEGDIGLAATGDKHRAGIDALAQGVGQMEGVARSKAGTVDAQRGRPGIADDREVDPLQREGQRLGLQAEGLGATAGAVEHHVVHARLGGGDHRRLVGHEGLFAGGVEAPARGHAAQAQIKLVAVVGARAVEGHAHGLAGSDRHLVEQRLPGTQRALGGHAQAERLHVDLHGVQAGRQVVGVVALGDVVEDVAAHDHVVRAWRQPGQRGGDRLAVAGAAVERAVDLGRAEHGVTDVPGAVGRDIEGVAPATQRCIAAEVADAVADAGQVARDAIGRDRDLAHHQVGRRCQADLDEAAVEAGVVGFHGLGDHAAAVGDDEDIERPGLAQRHREIGAGVVAVMGAQATAVITIAQVQVGIAVEDQVARQVDGVVPVMVAGRVVTGVADGPGHIEGLPADGAGRRLDRADLQVEPGRGWHDGRWHADRQRHRL